MADNTSYKPQPGQCCGECKHWIEGSAGLCKAVNLYANRGDGQTCTIFARREPEPEPEPEPKVESLKLTLRQAGPCSRCEIIIADAQNGHIPVYDYALHNALAAGPVTLTIPPQPCGECAIVRAERNDLRDECAAAWAEGDTLRARLIERNEEIERLGNALARIYGHATVVSVQSDNLRDTVLAELNALNATRGDA